MDWGRGTCASECSQLPWRPRGLSARCAGVGAGSADQRDPSLRDTRTHYHTRSVQYNETLHRVIRKHHPYRDALDKYRFNIKCTRNLSACPQWTENEEKHSMDTNLNDRSDMSTGNGGFPFVFLPLFCRSPVSPATVF